MNIRKRIEYLIETYEKKETLIETKFPLLMEYLEEDNYSIATI